MCVAGSDCAATFKKRFNSLREFTMRKKIKCFVALSALVAFIAGCNTVEGFGRDLGKLGDKIEHKAEQKRSY